MSRHKIIQSLHLLDPMLAMRFKNLDVDLKEEEDESEEDQEDNEDLIDSPVPGLDQKYKKVSSPCHSLLIFVER